MCIQGKRLQVQPVTTWSSTMQMFAIDSFLGPDVAAKRTVLSAFVTFSTLHIRPFQSPPRIITNTLLFVGRLGARSWSETSPCCHLPLLSVQYKATLDGRKGWSNWRGILVYPIRLPPANFGPKATRMCFPWIPSQRELVRKDCERIGSIILEISGYDK